jgi:YHS domain-containing protein
MLRFLGYLIMAVFLITLIRSVIGILARLFSSAVLGSGGSPAAPRQRPTVPMGGTLHKDPVCGTYVSEHAAVKLMDPEGTIYFCSQECRNKYRAG